CKASRVQHETPSLSWRDSHIILSKAIRAKSAHPPLSTGQPWDQPQHYKNEENMETRESGQKRKAETPGLPQAPSAISSNNNKQKKWRESMSKQKIKSVNSSGKPFTSLAIETRRKEF
ncbi:hypothetical protein HispidOSU_025397, partial [Sigmodon hispidus]